ncbi:hypothetical protein BRC72_08120 [Halobacteriales archaeon QH_7_66_36]|nr:MAG: hypothetical protein BRC72_08120 [Halobacteriales archaeon QH_7_66_36]
MSTSKADSIAVDVASLSGLHWVGIVAAVVTGVIHLRLGVGFAPSGLGISFLLAGLGFFGAVGLVLFDYRRRTVYAAGVPFTIVQIVLWYALNFAGGPKSFPADVGTLGWVDKIAQVALVVVLVALLQQS